MPDKLTLFYMKRTGEIKAFCTGEQNMNFYGDEKEDYEEIIDFIVIPYDPFIITNRDYYLVKDNKLIFTREGD